jgi:1-acyl-sn-glycerol-3-phosphate acyltransferase
LLRIGRIVALLTALTLLLLPFQLLSLLLGLSTQRLIPSLYHRIVCRIVGIRVHVSGTPAAEAQLIVANHASWLDIAVISAAAPVAFVAKSEVAQWPIFGWLAKLQRSVFVDRKRRSQTAHATREIAGRLRDGDRIVLFAEGTSSDGNRVLPFRSSLIGAAGDLLRDNKSHSRVLIQPLSVAYVGLHGMPMLRRERRRAAWYGGADLLPHLTDVLRDGRIDVVLSWGAPVPYLPESNRKILARDIEQRVRRLTTTALRLPVPAGTKAAKQPAFGGEVIAHVGA